MSGTSAMDVIWYRCLTLSLKSLLVVLLLHLANVRAASELAYATDTDTKSRSPYNSPFLFTNLTWQLTNPDKNPGLIHDPKSLSVSEVKVNVLVSYVRMTTVLMWTKMMHSQSFGVSYDRDIARRTREEANICRPDIDTAEIVVIVSGLQNPPEVVSAGNLGSFLTCAAWASCFMRVVFWLR